MNKVLRKIFATKLKRGDIVEFNKMSGVVQNFVECSKERCIIRGKEIYYKDCEHVVVLIRRFGRTDNYVVCCKDIKFTRENKEITE